MEKKKLTQKQTDFAKNIIKLGKKEAKKCAELAGYKNNPEKWAKKLLKDKAIKALIKNEQPEAKKDNSKHKNATSFSSEYQPKEKWTLEAAMKVGEDLLKWLREKDEEGNDKGNIFYKEFLIMENDYELKLINYLRKKFKPFSTLIEKAEEIQELKLQKYGVGDRLNSSMTKFVLINKHNWKDKIDIDTKNLNVNYDNEIKEESTQQEASQIYQSIMKGK